MKLHVARVLNGEYRLDGVHFTKPHILDLGANYGAFAVWARDRWPDATIECYEPNPETFRVLQQNCPFAKLHQLAVTDHGGIGYLRKGAGNCGECSLYDLGEQTDENVIVRVISSAALPPADIMKIDTEGAEYLTLYLYPHLKKLRAVMLEWHSIIDRYAIGNLLCGVGMKFYSDDSWRGNRGIMKFYRDGL